MCMLTPEEAVNTVKHVGGFNDDFETIVVSELLFNSLCLLQRHSQFFIDMDDSCCYLLDTDTYLG